MNTLPLTRGDVPPSPFLADHTKEQEILSFRLGDEEYGIPLLCVQEIRSFQTPTRLAGARKDLLGVIDLRGEIVPLFDLRLRFALARADFDPFTVVIVVQIHGRCIGVVADGVNDVAALQPDQIRKMPALKGGPDQAHLRAVACIGERRVVLMDIESMLRDTTQIPQLH